MPIILIESKMNRLKEEFLQLTKETQNKPGNGEGDEPAAINGAELAEEADSDLEI